MNMITDHHDYSNGYIGLMNLELSDLPATQQVEGYELLLKSEFHISLICAKRIAALIDTDKATEIEAEIVEAFMGFIVNEPLTDYALTDEYRLVKKDDRVTLVAMAAVPGLDGFFNELERKYGLGLPTQPTHITLYTLQPEAGIGILSQEELGQNSTIVDVQLNI